MSTELRGLPFKLCSLSSLIAAISSTASASTTIGSLPGGPGAVATAEDIGQTFVVPTDGDNAFSNFTAYLGGAAGDITFTTSLYQFNGSQVVGPALYTSAPQEAVENDFNAAFSFSPVTPIPLTAGGTYIFTFHQSAAVPTGNIQWTDSTNYPAGQIMQTGGSPPYSGDTWLAYSVTSPLDIAFSATFVPEPAGLSGLFVAWALGRRCRRRLQPS
jgi:hypothetical protein